MRRLFWKALPGLSFVLLIFLADYAQHLKKGTTTMDLKNHRCILVLSPSTDPVAAERWIAQMAGAVDPELFPLVFDTIVLHNRDEAKLLIADLTKADFKRDVVIVGNEMMSLMFTPVSLTTAFKMGYATIGAVRYNYLQLMLHPVWKNEGAVEQGIAGMNELRLRAVSLEFLRRVEGRETQTMRVKTAKKLVKELEREYPQQVYPVKVPPMPTLDSTVSFWDALIQWLRNLVNRGAANDSLTQPSVIEGLGKLVVKPWALVAVGLLAVVAGVVISC